MSPGKWVFSSPGPEARSQHPGDQPRGTADLASAPAPRLPRTPIGAVFSPRCPHGGGFTRREARPRRRGQPGFNSRLGFQPVPPAVGPVERAPEAGGEAAAQQTGVAGDTEGRGVSPGGVLPPVPGAPRRAGASAGWGCSLLPAAGPLAGRGQTQSPGPRGWRVVRAAAGRLGEAPGQPSPGGRQPVTDPAAHAHPGPRPSASVSRDVAWPLLPPCWRPFLKPCPASLGSGVLLPALSVPGSAVAQARDLWPVGPARAPEQNRCGGWHEWPATPSKESVFSGTRWLVRGSKHSEGPSAQSLRITGIRVPPCRWFQPPLATRDGRHISAWSLTLR